MPGYCSGTKSMAGCCQRCKKPILKVPEQQVEKWKRKGLKKQLTTVS